MGLEPTSEQPLPGGPIGPAQNPRVIVWPHVLTGSGVAFPTQGGTVLTQLPSAGFVSIIPLQS